MRRQFWKGKSNCVATKLFLVYSATYLVTNMPLERRPLASKLPVGPFFFLFFKCKYLLPQKQESLLSLQKCPSLVQAALVVAQT